MHGNKQGTWGQRHTCESETKQKQPKQKQDSCHYGFVDEENIAKAELEENSTQRFAKEDMTE